MADAGPERSAAWKVVRTDEFRRWVGGLSAERGAQIEAAIRRVESEGPLLRRPRADSIHECRCADGSLRASGGLAETLSMLLTRGEVAASSLLCAALHVAGSGECQTIRTHRYLAAYRRSRPCEERLQKIQREGVRLPTNT
jgi:hypothetical protein